MIAQSHQRHSPWIAGVLTLAALGILSTQTGCPPPIPPDDPRLVKAHQLPGDVPGLLAYADKKETLARANLGFDRRAAADALQALRKARRLQPGQHDVLLHGARLARDLGDHARSPGEQLKYAQLGMAFSGPGCQRFPKEVAFHYFQAALLGLKVDAYRAAAMSVVPKLRAAAEKALKRDRGYDHAGPLRILGSLLVQVPATAPFNGDIDRGTALLEEAVKRAPEQPLNHYFLADAYAKDDEVARAVKHYGRVLCARPGSGWDRVLAKRWRNKARLALKALKKPAPPCP